MTVARSFARRWITLALLVAGASCRDEPGAHAPPPASMLDAQPVADAAPPADGGSPPLDVDAATAPDSGDGSDAGAPSDEGSVVVASWNLHNFSIYGARERRLDAVSAQIRALASDVIAVQEIKVEDGTAGVGPQAWDSLLALLPELEGVHNPYDTFDTTVGLLVHRESTTILDWQTILTDDRNALPRPPLDATVRVVRGTTDVTFHVVVVHLKAFGDSVDRRRSACTLLRAYIEAQADQRYLVIGDWNDDPYDPPAENSFTGTFLDAEPDYVFITAALPPESVTSVGYYHEVAGRRIVGELLDHAVATRSLLDHFARAVPSIVARPPSEYDAWASTHSDHFPIVVRLEP